MKEQRRQTVKISDPGLKAYIYQQIIEFEPFFLPDSNIGVAVEKEMTSKKSAHYFVTMVLTGGGTYVRSTGKDKNIYSATLKAKKDILDHLYSIQKKITPKNTLMH